MATWLSLASDSFGKVLWQGAPTIAHMQCYSLCACYAGIANFLTGYNAGGVSMTYNGFSKAVTAALLFKASGSFDRAVTAPGCNMAALLSAIGPHGLTKLWHQLTVFAWTVALSQVSLTVHPGLSAVCACPECLLDLASCCQPPPSDRPQHAVASARYLCLDGSVFTSECFTQCCTWPLQYPLAMAVALYEIPRIFTLTCVHSVAHAMLWVSTPCKSCQGFKASQGTMKRQLAQAIFLMS